MQRWESRGASLPPDIAKFNISHCALSKSFLCITWRKHLSLGEAFCMPSPLRAKLLHWVFTVAIRTAVPVRDWLGSFQRRRCFR